MLICGNCSYDASVWGPSGNHTINGKLTYGSINEALAKRGLGAGGLQDVNLTAPPYAIHNGISILPSSCLLLCI